MTVVGHVALLASLVLWTGQAAAEPVDELEGVMAVPGECMDLIPEDTESPIYWDRVMSLAACVQDTPVGAVDDRSQLTALIEDQIDAITPAMVLYSNVLQRGPAKARFRATYHVALASIALITRARRSIAVTGPRAEERERVLRETLELRLAPIREMARSALATVVNGARSLPEVGDDPVGRNMLRSATQLLAALGTTKIPELQLAQR